MTEANQVCRIVSDRLRPYGRIIRIQDAVGIGIPDYYYCVKGVSGWLECKLLPKNGRCPEHFTLAQVLWAEEEVLNGGRWFLLGKRATEWLLYDAVGARAFKNGDKAWTLLCQTGPFPTVDILKALTGRSGQRAIYHL